MQTYGTCIYNLRLKSTQLCRRWLKKWFVTVHNGKPVPARGANPTLPTPQSCSGYISAWPITERCPLQARMTGCNWRRGCLELSAVLVEGSSLTNAGSPLFARQTALFHVLGGMGGRWGWPWWTKGLIHNKAASCIYVHEALSSL